jgi:glyoxylase-like metal-dependent hydrolase (beta-lactamase superfamily II)
MLLIGRSKEQAEMFGLTILAKPQADGFLEDEGVISFGNSHLKIIHLPGHSPGGIGLYCPEQDFVIAGDVLFRGSIGRTDLPGGSYDTLINTIQSKLMTLEDTTLVYCGHGPETTIGEERSTNPFLL